MDHALPVDTIMIAGLNDIRPIVKSVYDSRANPNNQPDNEVVCHLIQELFMEKVSRIWTIMQVHWKAKDTDDTLAVSRIHEEVHLQQVQGGHQVEHDALCRKVPH